MLSLLVAHHAHTLTLTLSHSLYPSSLSARRHCVCHDTTVHKMCWPLCSCHQTSLASTNDQSVTLIALFESLAYSPGTRGPCSHFTHTHTRTHTHIHTPPGGKALMRAVRAGDETAVSELLAGEPDIIHFRNYVSPRLVTHATCCAFV